MSTRRLKVPPEVARQKVDPLSSLEVVQIDISLILETIDLGLLRQFSFWDALIERWPQRQTMPLASALPRGRYQVPSGQMLATSAVTAASVAALVLLFQRWIV